MKILQIMASCLFLRLSKVLVKFLRNIINIIGVWRSWLAYLHGVQGVACSSQVTPTVENKAVTTAERGSCFIHFQTIFKQLR